MNDSKQEQSSFGIAWCLKVLKKYLILIFVCTICGLMSAMVISNLLITPTYSSTIDVLVNKKNNNSQTEFTTQQADLQLINTYKDVLKKPVVLRPVLNYAKASENYSKSLAELSDSISINNSVNSQLLSVTVKDKNAYTAADIANKIGKVFIKKIKKIMQVDNVTIVTKATPNLIPTSPNKEIYAILGFVIGLIIGILIAIIKEYFNKSVQDNDFLKEELNLVDLGQVYHIDNEKRTFGIVKVIDKNSIETKERRI